MIRYAAILLLAACTPAAETPPPPAAEPAPPPAFVGRWAVNADYCVHYAWSFRADGISTPGEVSCRWDRAERTATGWRLPATCLSEGSTTSEPVILVSEGRDAMNIDGGFWDGPIRLVRCS